MFALLVVLMGLLGKFIGGFAGSKLVGFESWDSLIFGIGVMPRAGVELVVISIGMSLGIIEKEVFSAIVLMVAVSIIVSPVLLKMAIMSREKHMST
jgi:Kef-type K+ transport system membrane component KefB